MGLLRSPALDMSHAAAELLLSTSDRDSIMSAAGEEPPERARRTSPHPPPAAEIIIIAVIIVVVVVVLEPVNCNLCCCCLLCNVSLASRCTLCVSVSTTDCDVLPRTLRLVVGRQCVRIVSRFTIAFGLFLSGRTPASGMLLQNLTWYRPKK